MKSEIKKERKLWKEIIKEFGNYQIIEEESQLVEIDANRIWTHYSGSGSNDFILNKFSELEIGDGEVINYFIFERPYSKRNEPIYLTTTFWEDCECEGEEDECEQCEGKGTIPFDVI